MSHVGNNQQQDELQKYELHHRARIAIKPGITGMWQVSGMNITVRQSRQSGVARATCPD